MKVEIFTSWRGFPQGNDSPLATERKAMNTWLYLSVYRLSWGPKNTMQS